MLLTLWAKLDSSQASVVAAMYLRPVHPGEREITNPKSLDTTSFIILNIYIYIGNRL